MKFKSQTYTQTSGSIGGITYSHNRGGLYTRARSIPVNPNSVHQQAVRSTASILTARWSKTLTETQRAAWTVYAQNTPVPDALGDPQTLSGIAMFLRCNTVRIRAGLTVVDNGPTTFGNDAFTLPVLTVTVPSTLSIAYTNTDAWAGEVGGALIVQQGLPSNLARTFFNGPWRFAGKALGAGTPPTSPLNITGVSTPFPFGSTNRIFCRVRTCRQDGRISAAVVINDTP